jgi:hypothetical protein
MKIQLFIISLFMGGIGLSNQSIVQAQTIRLPNITVASFNGRVVVKWMHTEKQISNILIQRSYDSTRHFSTIGTVLNPLNTENGYLDQAPPYDRMYYRVMVMYEGGQYIIGPSARSPNQVKPMSELNVTYYPVRSIDNPVSPIKEASAVNIAVNIDSSMTTSTIDDEMTGINPKSIDSTSLSISAAKGVTSLKNTIPKSITDSSRTVPKPKLIYTAYPSYRVYISKTNQLNITLPYQQLEEYRIVFFNEHNEQLFELKHVSEPSFILQKSNFHQAGWYYVEIYKGAELIEKNRFFIAKEKFKSMLN